jgi:hypothetical protein
MSALGNYNMGRTTIAAAGTSCALDADTSVWRSVIVQAAPDNTGNVYIGFGSSTANLLAATPLHFAELTPGHFTSVPWGRLSDIYADVAVNGDIVNWGCVR